MSKNIMDWLTELKIIKDEETRRLYDDERADFHGGCPFRSTSFDRLLAVSKFLVLWIPFDDIVAESDGDYCDKFKVWAEHVMQISPIFPGDEFADKIRIAIEELASRFRGFERLSRKVEWNTVLHVRGPIALPIRALTR